MSRRRKRAKVVMPPPGYSRPAALSPDGLTLGPLVNEDGEVIGPHDFHATRSRKGLLLPLVASLARAASPAGRWRSPKSVVGGAWIVRRIAEEMPEQHPEVQSIGDVTPDVYLDWVRAGEAREEWPTRTYLARVVLEGAQGLPADTLRVVRTRQAHTPEHAAERAYGIRDFVLIRRAARRSGDALETRLRANREALALYQAGQEPLDAPRVKMRGRLWSIGEILDHLNRTARMPVTWHGASAKKREFLGDALHLPPGRHLYYQALFPSRADIYAVMLRLACARGLNASSMARLRLSDIHRAGLDGVGQPVYAVRVVKPRSGPRRRYRSVTFHGSAARILEQAIFVTQGVRDGLAGQGYPTDQLLVTGSGHRTRHPSRVFSTDVLTTHELSEAWHKKEVVRRKDGSPVEVRLRRVRKTYQVLRRQSAQNTQEVHERDYVRHDPRTHELARREAEQAQEEMLADARTVAGLKLNADDLATARVSPESVARNVGLRPDQVRDVVEGRLDTYGGTACRDIFHSPHPQDEGGTCTRPPVDCAGCRNSISTPEHLPAQLALLRVFEARAAAVHGTRWEGEFDVYVLRYRHLVGGATAAELKQAETMITADHIAHAERVARGDFEV